MINGHKPKSITLTKSKSNGAAAPRAANAGQPLTAQQRATKFAPLLGTNSSTQRATKARQRQPEYDETEDKEEDEERRSRSSSKARSEEEEEEYEQEEQSPPRRSPTPPPKQKRPRTPPRDTSNSSRGGSSKQVKVKETKEQPRGLGREYSSLLLQNIPRHMEATDLFLNVFDPSDDAAEIEMHTHEDGSSTGTAQMYFEREGAAEAAARKHNGKMVEDHVLRMLVIKAVSKQKTSAPASPKRKRASPSPPPKKPQVARTKRSQLNEAPRAESSVTKPLVKPDVRKPKEAVAVKAKSERKPSQIAWAVEDTDSFVGFAPQEQEETERTHRPEVVRPRVTKTKVESSVQVVRRMGGPHQVYLTKNKDKYSR